MGKFYEADNAGIVCFQFVDQKLRQFNGTGGISSISNGVCGVLEELNMVMVDCKVFSFSDGKISS